MPIGSTNYPTSLDSMTTLVEATNNASTTLVSTMAINATSFVGNNSENQISKFPQNGGIVRIDDEIISYSSIINGNQFVVESRGLENTVAAAHDSGATVSLDITALSNNVKNSAIIAVETKVGIGSSSPTSNTVLVGTGSGSSNWQLLSNDNVSGTADISLSKLQPVNNSTLLGRGPSGGNGDIQELTLGSGLQMSGTTVSTSSREVLTADRTYWVGFLPGSEGTGACTISIANPAVITCAGSNLQVNDPVVFSTNNALPTGITAGVTYYVRTSDLTADQFTISEIAGSGGVNNNTAVVTSGSQLGNHTVRTGNDNNIGYGTNGRNVALLTYQKAVDLAGSIDPSIYKITIKGASGRYANPVSVNSMKLIKRLDVIGDDRYLAGVTFMQGEPITDNVAILMDGRAGSGSATVTWSGSTITVTGASTTCTFTAGSINVSIPSHLYTVNSRVRFSNSGGALPSPLSASTIYYVESVVNSNVVTLKSTISGSAITISGTGSGTHTATSLPDFERDGWGKRDQIIITVPGTGSPGVPSYTPLPISSVTVNTITVSGTLPATGSGVAGSSLTICPDVFLLPTTNGGRLVGGDFNVISTTGLFVKGFRFSYSYSNTGFADSLRIGPSSFVSVGWCLFDHRSNPTAVTASGISVGGGASDSVGLDVVAHMPFTVLGTFRVVGLLVQANGSIVARSGRFIGCSQGVSANDRSFVDCGNYRMYNVGSGTGPLYGITAARGSYIYAINGTYLQGINDTNPTANTLGSRMNFVQTSN